MFVRNLEVFRNYKTPNWLSDLRLLGISAQEDQKWLAESVIPEAVDHGLSKLAMIITNSSENVSHEDYVKKFQVILERYNVKARYFTSLNAGRQWLVEQ